MATVEEDVAHVRAVHAALTEEPLTVWMYSWQNKNDDGVELYASEERARNELLDDAVDAMNDLGHTDEQQKEITADIVLGKVSYFSDGADRYFSYMQRVVQT